MRLPTAQKLKPDDGIGACISHDSESSAKLRLAQIFQIKFLSFRKIEITTRDICNRQLQTLLRESFL
jgi:hypothetical protein